MTLRHSTYPIKPILKWNCGSNNYCPTHIDSRYHKKKKLLYNPYPNEQIGKWRIRISLFLPNEQKCKLVNDYACYKKSCREKNELSMLIQHIHCTYLLSYV